MKPLIFLIFTAFINPPSSTYGVTWLTDFEQAKWKASQENKMILLNFSGSDWCAPCIRLKEKIFASEIFLQHAEDNLVLANADFPRLKKNQLGKKQILHNEDLAEKYNPDGKFPLTILLNASGKLIKQWEGVPQKTAKQFVEDLKNF